MKMKLGMSYEWKTKKVQRIHNLRLDKQLNENVNRSSFFAGHYFF